MYNPETGAPLDGWKGTLMGDPHGTGVTQRDICAIAQANRACRVPGKKKDILCCEGYDNTVIGENLLAIPAQTDAIPQAPTTGPRHTVVFNDTGQMAVVLHAGTAPVMDARGTTHAAARE